MTDFNNPQDQVLDNNKITWYMVKANLVFTEKEKEERMKAIKHQINIGVIQPNGLPIGITPKMVGAPDPMPQRNQQRLGQTRQTNSHLGYLNKPKLSPQEMFNQRFGIRK